MLAQAPPARSPMTWEADMQACVDVLNFSLHLGTSVQSAHVRTLSCRSVLVLAAEQSVWRASRPHHCDYVCLGVGESVSLLSGIVTFHHRRHPLRSRSRLVAGHPSCWISAFSVLRIHCIMSVSYRGNGGALTSANSTSTASHVRRTQPPK
jgi:hypothetical protein